MGVEMEYAEAAVGFAAGIGVIVGCVARGEVDDALLFDKAIAAEISSSVVLSTDPFTLCWDSVWLSARSVKPASWLLFEFVLLVDGVAFPPIDFFLICPLEAGRVFFARMALFLPSAAAATTFTFDFERTAVDDD